MAKTKEILKEIKMVLGCIILIIVLYAMARTALGYINSKRITKVVDCEAVNGTEYYEITVELSNGERYAYFDDEYKEIGTVIVASFDSDNSSIIDAQQ